MSLLELGEAFALPLKSFLPEPIWELPNTDEGGGPAGVKDPAEDGGRPAAAFPKQISPALLNINKIVRQLHRNYTSLPVYTLRQLTWGCRDTGAKSL